ncbi:MAG: hypothetical protein WAZ94_08520 [Phycisphaerales bacterium]
MRIRWRNVFIAAAVLIVTAWKGGVVRDAISDAWQGAFERFDPNDPLQLALAALLGLLALVVLRRAWGVGTNGKGPTS